jgi:hypothetical protein
MMYVECNADCQGAGEWRSLELFGLSDAKMSWSMQVDPTSGGVRMAYKHVSIPGLWMMWCHADCLTIKSWDGVSLSLDDASGGDNPALALDTQGRPHIAYEHVGQSTNGIGYLHCSQDCYTISTNHTGVWKDEVVEDNVTLLEEYPLWLPGGCKDPAWLSGLRPALAVDGQGRTRFAFEADGYSYCNKGTIEDPWFVYGQYWGTSRLIFKR